MEEGSNCLLPSPPGKTSFKKPSLIRVKLMTLISSLMEIAVLENYIKHLEDFIRNIIQPTLRFTIFVLYSLAFLVWGKFIVHLRASFKAHTTITRITQARYVSFPSFLTFFALAGFHKSFQEVLWRCVFRTLSNTQDGAFSGEQLTTVSRYLRKK